MMSSSGAVESDVGNAMTMETDEEIDQLVVSLLWWIVLDDFHIFTVYGNCMLRAF